MDVMKTLFLNPPSYDDFDGGAGSRYQATREVWSFWYPTWLAYPAGMIPGARLLDARRRHLEMFPVSIRVQRLILDSPRQAQIPSGAKHAVVGPAEDSGENRGRGPQIDHRCPHWIVQQVSRCRGRPVAVAVRQSVRLG